MAGKTKNTDSTIGATGFQVTSWDETMIQHYLAKGFDRETAEALAVLNNRGQHKVEG
jgi:hypothetical protein